MEAKVASILCSSDADSLFGPAVASCRREFDFTIVFEESTLSLLPATLFSILALAHLLRLFANRAPTVARLGLLYALKLGASLVTAAVQIAILALQNPPAANPSRTSVTIAAAAVNASAGILVVALSHFEHLKSCRPSSLLVAFLGLTCLFDATRTRTYWLVGERAVAGSLLASVLLKALLVALESQEKRKLFRLPELSEKAPEELAGPISRTLFQWLNALFLRGYRELLVPADIAPIDSRLTSGQLRARFGPIDAKARDPAGFSKNGLVILTFRCLGWDLAYPAIAKLAVIGFTFAQPFLVTAVLNHLDPNNPPASHGYGLVGTSFLVYVGIAASQSWYGHMSNRAAVMIRGALCTSLFEKLLRLPENEEIEAQAITLVINNVERITRNVTYLHDTWAALIETPLATWLLYRLLGPSCLAIFVVIFASLLTLSWVSSGMSERQQEWLVAVQLRIAATKKMLASLKAVKMLGADTRVGSVIRRLREREITAAWPYRQRIILTLFLSYTTITLSPPLVFGVYIAVFGGGGASFDVTRIFTSLVLITLLSNPLISLFQVIPGLAAAHGCFKRIQDFLEMQERADPRTMADGTEHADVSEKPPTGPADPISPGTTLLSLKDASFGWPGAGEGVNAVLSGIDLNVQAGKRIAIMGPVGCGKSMLLKALLGEVSRLSGTLLVAPGATFAYCSQSPWLENVSAQQNLARYGPPGMSKDSEIFYRRVAQECALEDIISLPGYASVPVGSGGALLSGGQRQRLALARAVALQRDVLLLDDVFSALDRKTRMRVARSLFHAQPSNRTIILTTHDTHIASLADEVYRITATGRLERVVLEDDEEDGVVWATGSPTDTSVREDSAAPRASQSLPAPSPTTASSDTARQGPSEKDQHGDSAVYADYFKSMGLINFACLVLLGLSSTITFKLPDLWVQWWTSAAAAGDRRNGYWLGLYTMLQALALLTVSVWVWHLMAKVVPRSGRSLHERLLSTVLNAQYPYISRVDTGGIINRFNQDLMFVDSMLPMDLINTVAELFTSAMQILLISIASLHVLSAVPFLAGLLYLIQHFYLRTSKQLRLLDLESKAALHTRIAEASAGSALSTIRAHGWSALIRDRYMDSFDRSQEPTYLLLSVQRWLFLVLNLVVTGLVMLMVGVAISLRDKVNAGAVGVAFLNATTLGETMTRLIVSWTGLETSLGAIARISRFEKETPTETDHEEIAGQSSADSLPPSWPQRGSVRLENVWATYSSTDAAPPSSTENPEDAQWSLRGVTLDLQPGERVAICGRTGSGKSTLLLALLRMVYLPAGSILIDGVDCSSLQLSTLRRGFHVISQDRFEEAGTADGDSDKGNHIVTLRHELDPEGLFPDEAVEETVRACGNGLWERVKAAGGLRAPRADITFSVGEAQLLAVARTVLNGTLKDGGVVLLDEATSSVDRDTELKIEELITTRLRNKTVISVNHRLEAALGYDKIAVMEKGRIVDFGTPREMLERCDLFKGLSIRN